MIDNPYENNRFQKANELFYYYSFFVWKPCQPANCRFNDDNDEDFNEYTKYNIRVY